VNNARAMSILEHLGELKRRMVRVALVFLIATVAAGIFYEPVFEFLRGPAEHALAESEGDIIFTKPAEVWGAVMKVSVILGFTAAVPYFLLELTLFLRPGLKPNERRYLYFLFPFGTISFAAGVWFAFEVLIPPAINFLLIFGAELATPYPSIDSYISLIISIMFWMGLIFELPVVMFFLAKIGIVNSPWLIKQWRWVILFAFVLGALVTPTLDPVTQTLVAGPVIILYALGVVLAKLAERGREEIPAPAESPAGGSD
jgi:sec-independent protein translocase protein TatC